MPDADKNVLLRAQLVLTREREISQMLVDGLLGKNFSLALAFFLNKHRSYMLMMTRLCRTGRTTDTIPEKISCDAQEA